ncbi:MAG: hypothetical protein RLY20_28 [Verrucomicrobiota bacterium]
MGQKLGIKLRDVITIVTYRTFRRWLNAGDPPPGEERSSKGGRPKTRVDVRALVLQMASENGWGFGRILGELKKLGIGIAKSTVKAILRENGFDTGPNRARGSWAEFVERHAKTLWACDFFQKKIWTTSGLVDYFVLFFIHVGSRRVFMAGMTTNPTGPWVTQQARNMAMIFPDEADEPTHLIRDNDPKFTSRFDAVFESENMEVVRTAIRAPNMNAHVERFLQSLQQECLDHFVVFGEDHFRHLINEYLTHYNGRRPHQGLDNRPLDGHSFELPTDWTHADLECTESLGGLLKSYRWKTAA